ncbi:MAG: glycosyltransferase family 4 protein [archaeon]|nr:glycosyltransferase family 4 protein [archaeon]
MNVLMHAAGPFFEEGGVSRVVIELSRELRLKGVDVDFIFGTNPENYPNVDSYLDFLKGPLKIIKHSSLTGLLFSNKITGRKYDVIHSHTPEAAFDSLKFSSKTKTKTLVHLHGFDKGLYEEWLKEINLNRLQNDFFTNYYLRKSISKGDKVFDECENFCAISRSVIVEAEKFYSKTPSLVYNAFNPEEKKFSISQSALRKKLGVGKDEKIVLFVGNNGWRKGLPYLLDAMKILPSNYRLVVIGLNETINNKKVINIGCLPHTALFDYYALADVFCMPSLYEPFGLVYLEAQSCETPCVGSFGTAAEELITDKRNGFLAKKRDFQSIADSIEKAVELKGKIKTDFKKFSWEKSAKELLKIYDSL